ncbi:hypothetical protein AX16_005920 [Volvariella volvacea WC 439]|nr:hypothetical protein AX16_005920 [Volvariella volvacea WC 439]
MVDLGPTHFLQFCIQWSSIGTYPVPMFPPLPFCQELTHPFPALLYYDYVLTFPAEVRYIWQEKFKLSSALYICCRYALVSNVVYLLALANKLESVRPIRDPTPLGGLIAVFMVIIEFTSWGLTAFRCIQALKITGGSWRTQKNGFIYLILEQGLLYFAAVSILAVSSLVLNVSIPVSGCTQALTSIADYDDSGGLFPTTAKRIQPTCILHAHCAFPAPSAALGGEAIRRRLNESILLQNGRRIWDGSGAYLEKREARQASGEQWHHYR